MAPGGRVRPGVPVTAGTVVPLIVSLIGCVLLHREAAPFSESRWLDLWAVMALAPLVFFVIDLIVRVTPY